ncbi:vWA domain-containing protein [Dietzia maris]
MSNYTASERWDRAVEGRPNLGLDAAKILPFYFVVDVSYSMENDLDVVTAELINLRNTMQSDPVLDDLCLLSVITFANDATVSVPMGKLSGVTDSSLELKPRGATNFETALRLLADDSARQIDELKVQNNDYQVYRPTAFFITDGYETAGDTQAGIDWLMSNKSRPNVIPFGFRDADSDAVRRLAVPGDGPSFMQREGANAEETISSIIKLVTRTIVTQTQTASRDDEFGGMVLMPEDRDVLIVQTANDIL